MNMQAILKQAQSMQRDIANAQKEINEMEFIGKNGLVTVVVSGTRNIKNVKIEEDEDLKEDLSILEDMITLAINDAFKQIDDVTNKKLGKYAICFFFSLVLSISNNSETVLSIGIRLFSSEISVIFFLPMLIR